MTEPAITRRQLKRLQTLWGLLCRHVGMPNDNRNARLAWVGQKIGRKIPSFLDLTRKEAERAVDELQKHLPAELLTRNLTKRPDRRFAHALGTAGRKGYKSKVDALPDARAWERLNSALTALGWTRERLDAFLESHSSPTRGAQIRTLAQLNAVHWALKRILKRRASSSAPGSTTPWGPGSTPGARSKAEEVPANA
jgi:hypothetical protein